MFYRRKVILALLQLFDGQLEKIRFQKLLFLFTRQQSKTEYDFVPYRFGCYSFSLNADLSTMVKKGILNEIGTEISLINPINFISGLKPDDKKFLMEVKASYGGMSAKSLIIFYRHGVNPI